MDSQKSVHVPCENTIILMTESIPCYVLFAPHLSIPCKKKKKNKATILIPFFNSK